MNNSEKICQERKKMESKVYYAMSFYNTTDTMQTEKKAREQFEIHIMPTPRAISTSCGLAIRFEGVDEQAYLQFALQQQVPLWLYRIEMKEDGEPKAESIFVREP